MATPLVVYEISKKLSKNHKEILFTLLKSSDQNKKTLTKELEQEVDLKTYKELIELGLITEIKGSIARFIPTDTAWGVLLFLEIGFFYFFLENIPVSLGLISLVLNIILMLGLKIHG